LRVVDYEHLFLHEEVFRVLRSREMHVGGHVEGQSEDCCGVEELP
jgi:hypothetical protein